MNITEKELDDLLEQAARRGAKIAIEEMTNDIYQAVGKGVIRKFWYLLGVVAVSFVAWGLKNGWFSN